MSISDNVRRRVHEVAQHRCGYCLVSAGFVYAPMQIDHIIPSAIGGTDEEENLWLACPRCNNYKSDSIRAIDPRTKTEVTLFNPRTQNWHDHFGWNPDDAALIISNTPTGRATIEALRLNSDENLQFRRLLVSVGWYPPRD